MYYKLSFWGCYFLNHIYEIEGELETIMQKVSGAIDKKRYPTRQEEEDARIRAGNFFRLYELQTKGQIKTDCEEKAAKIPRPITRFCQGATEHHNQKYDESCKQETQAITSATLYPIVKKALLSLKEQLTVYDLILFSAALIKPGYCVTTPKFQEFMEKLGISITIANLTTWVSNMKIGRFCGRRILLENGEKGELCTIGIFKRNMQPIRASQDGRFYIKEKFSQLLGEGGQLTNFLDGVLDKTHF